MLCRTACTTRCCPVPIGHCSRRLLCWTVPRLRQLLLPRSGLLRYVEFDGPHTVPAGIAGQALASFLHGGATTRSDDERGPGMQQQGIDAEEECARVRVRVPWGGDPPRVPVLKCRRVSAPDSTCNAGLCRDRFTRANCMPYTR